MARSFNHGDRFYGRRKGQALSAHKKHLLETILPRVAISITAILPGTLDPKTLFDFSIKNVWLEIGFGKGEHLALQAKNNPGIGFIGCEPYINGVAGLVDLIHKQNLKNIRIYPDDARHFLPLLQRASLRRVFLLHPDPWPKKRHAKRRFVSNTNLDVLAQIMKSGAELRIGTDHLAYMAWTMIKLQHRQDFVWAAERAEDWQKPPEDWFETRYAAKAKVEAQRCAYFTFIRTIVP